MSEQKKLSNDSLIVALRRLHDWALAQEGDCMFSGDHPIAQAAAVLSGVTLDANGTHDGWKLVPPEATPEMVKAWEDVPIVVPPGTSDEQANAIVANLNWKAMLSAAPVTKAQHNRMMHAAEDKCNPADCRAVGYCIQAAKDGEGQRPAGICDAEHPAAAALRQAGFGPEAQAEMNARMAFAEWRVCVWRERMRQGRLPRQWLGVPAMNSPFLLEQSEVKPSLHMAIMNLPCKFEAAWQTPAPSDWVEGYVNGHRDTRYAAAELANEHHVIEQELLEALQKIAAIEDKQFGHDWEEIEEAREIARAAIRKATLGSAS